MQMFKFLRNQSTNGDIQGEPKIDIDGHFFTKDQLLEARQVALDKLAREKDPNEINQLAITVAGLDSAIEAFTPILKAKAMAHRRARELQEEDQNIALAAQKQFGDLCNLITVAIQDRAGDQWADHMRSGHAKPYIMKGIALYSELFTKLSFEQAEAQFDEIDLAIKERREWRDVVPLPRYTSLVSVQVQRGRVDPESLAASGNSTRHRSYAEIGAD